MESNLVKDEYLYPKDSLSLVKSYFHKNIDNYSLLENGSYTGYWWVKYEAREENIVVVFDGDIGHHFTIYIYRWGKILLMAIQS